MEPTPVSPEVQEALQELSQYLSDTMPPMMVAGSQPTMLTVDMAFRINAYGDYATANALGVISYAMTAVAAWFYLRHNLAERRE